MTQLIALSKLPPPDVLEPLDFEQLLAARKAKFIGLHPEAEQDFWLARLSLESEPVTKLLEENCYLELLLRARINLAAKAVMLAYATGADLDHLAALFGVERILIRPEDLNQIPPQFAVYEDDERLRRRVQMSLEGITTAGSRGSYLFHTLSASAHIHDANISSPRPGKVLVTVLKNQQAEVEMEELLRLVRERLNDELVRPLTDEVVVQQGEIKTYQLHAQLTMLPSTIEATALANAERKAGEYVQKQYKLGADITLSGLYAALHQEGVQNVRILRPTADIVNLPTQVAICEQINISVRGRDE